MLIEPAHSSRGIDHQPEGQRAQRSQEQGDPADQQPSEAAQLQVSCQDDAAQKRQGEPEKRHRELGVANCDLRIMRSELRAANQELPITYIHPLPEFEPDFFEMGNFHEPELLMQPDAGWIG